MARRIENDCVGCPQGCINCGRKEYEVYICDECGEEVDPDDMHEYDNEEICIDCLFKKYPKISYN